MNIRFLLVCLVVSGLSCDLLAQGHSETNALYQTDFSKTEVGTVPPEFLVLEGQFAVRSDGTNQYLEVPGTPLDSLGVSFGPTFSPKTDAGIAVSARIYGSGQGRRYPVLAVGICGARGFRLQVTPSKKQLELYQNEAVLAAQPFEWINNAWTHLQLQIKRVDNRWTLEGRARSEGTNAAPATVITHLIEQEPLQGASTIWGVPYSGKPIRFDDLVVRRP